MSKNFSGMRARLRASVAQRLPWLRKSAVPAAPRSTGTHIKLGYRPSGEPLRFPLEERTDHTLIVSGTGGGKTTDLKWQVGQLLLCPQRRGLLLIDGNGGHVDSVYHHALALIHDLGIADNVPVHVLDLALGDVVSCVQPLTRCKGEDISVVAGSVLQSIAARGNEEAFEEKPAIRGNLSGVLAAGTELLLTLPDLSALLDVDDPNGLRRWAIDTVTDHHARRELRRVHVLAQQRSKGDYTARTEGTINRLSDHERSPIVRASLGGMLNGLDIGKTLDLGGIILVNGEGSSYASQPDTHVWARLVLSTAVRHLLVRESDRPCDIVIDECQHYLTDAEQLFREARKRRVRVTVATQFLATFEKVPGLLPAVMGGTNCKKIGRIMNFEDAELIAPYIEADVETAIQSSIQPVAVGQRRTTFKGNSQATTQTDGTSQSHGRSEGESVGDTFSRARGRSESFMRFSAESEAQMTGTTLGSSCSLSETSFAGESALTSSGAIQGTSLGTSLSVERDIWGQPQPNDVMGFSAGISNAASLGKAQGTSRGSASAHGETSSHAESRSASRGVSHGEGSAIGTSESEGYARSRARSKQRNWSFARSTSRGTSSGTSVTEGLETVYETRATNWHSLQNLQHKIAHVLMRLMPGQMVVLFDNKVEFVRVPFVKSKKRSLAELREIKTALMAKSNVVMRVEDALAAIESRQAALCKKAAECPARNAGADFKPAPMPIIDDPDGFAADVWSSGKVKLPDPPPPPKRKSREAEKPRPGEFRVIDGGKRDDADAGDKPPRGTPAA